MSAFNSFNVVDNYKSNLKQTNEQLVDKFFNDQIVAKSKINQQANEELANEIYALDKRIHKEQKIINLNRFGMIFMRCLSVVLFIIGVVFVCCNIWGSLYPTAMYLSIGIALIIVGAVIFGLSWLVKKRKIRFEQELDKTKQERENKYQKAREQLSGVFNLLNDRISFDLFEKTFSYVKFDDYLSIKNSKKWMNVLPYSNDESTIFAISGQVHDNPFIVHRRRLTEMYNEVYTGSITVMVERTRTVNNKTESYMAPKLIVASTVNPAPRYWTETQIEFLSQINSDLNYYNIDSLKKESHINKFYNKHKEMTTMENPDFDRLFPCIRNDEVSFRTTYTPLAQEEMVNLINNHNDNYSVSKKGLLTVVNNRQNIDLYYYANRYYKHFDLLALKDEFITFNTSFFNDIYFLLAPLLLIPIYIQTKYRDISNGTNGYSCFTMESKLNLQIDNNRFIHPESKTENILKVKHVSTNENSQTDEVTAYGYRTRLRVVIVPVMDLEAGLVNVPVTVIDYIPVSQSTTITTEIKQDEINAEDRKKMNFAWSVAILSASGPSETKPDKDKVIKSTNKTTD